MKHSTDIKKMVFSALAIALVFVTTYSIRIPLPTGYVNFGDIMIFATAILLGRSSAFIAGSFGSALADLLSGYGSYAPATFFIKGMEGLIFALIIYKFRNNASVILWNIVILISGIVSASVMVLGYFCYDTFMTGLASAVSSMVPGNLLQGAISAVAVVPIAIALKNTKYFSTRNNNI